MGNAKKLDELVQLIRDRVKAAPVAKPDLHVVGSGAPPTLRGYGWYDWNADALAAPAPLDQGDRARAIRRIEYLAGAHHWPTAITRALDAGRVQLIEELDDDALFGLRDQMERYLDAAMTGCDVDEMPPAR